jgi:hypothetical protein
MSMNIIIFAIFIAIVLFVIISAYLTIISTSGWSENTAIVVEKTDIGPGEVPIFKYLLEYKVGKEIYKGYPKKYILGPEGVEVGSNVNILYNPKNCLDIVMIDYKRNSYAIILYVDHLLRRNFRL